MSGHMNVEGNILVTGHVFKADYKDISLNASHIFDISARIRY